ncbi:helix-turn-helix domain-containing protein [Flavobacterium sp.]|jgi:AraC-like DNA-binding protein|uniref:helix-turn-helix domain-containing protein n=1 Tax=Flavobacterium sp. TaxID=239 RepID=UPI0037BFA536
MNLHLSIPDFLLFAATVLLIFTTLLLLRKVNSKNYMLIGTLAIYFSLITATILLILFTRYNIKLIDSATILVLMAIVYSLYNIFHYFSLQQLIAKKSRLSVQHLLHLAVILIVAILIFYFYEPIYFMKSKGYSFVFETQHLMSVQNKNLILRLVRIIHPIFYLMLGGYLLFAFYNSPRYLSMQKSTRSFIFFFYFQKVFLFFWVSIGFIGYKIDKNLFSSISMIGFSLTVLIMSSYILLSPNLLLQITKLNHISKKTAVDTSKFQDLFAQLNLLMDKNKYYLDANYSITNLSSDTDISANIIREVIAASGYKNFSAFINSFRIAHAERLISNGYLDTFSIESLCKDSGFQSEVTFYRVFKKVNHCTPKEFTYNLKNYKQTS